MFISRFIPATADRRERRLLAACIGLLAFYAAAFVVLQRTSTRFDLVFLAKRQQFLLQRQLGRPVPIDHVIDVTQHAQATPLIALLGGWSAVEPWGVWTDGPHAEMALAVPPSRQNSLMLLLWADIMLAADGRQDIKLGINGRHVGSWHITRGQAVLCAPVPADIVPATGLLLTTIDIGAPHAPPGSTTDDRALGLGLTKVEVASSRTGCVTAMPPNAE